MTDQALDKEKLYSRALCYYKTGCYSLCVKDCDETLALDPTMVKPLLMKADALQMLGKVMEAHAIYMNVTELEPDCEQARDGVKVCAEMLEKDEMMIAVQELFI